jgi:type VI protein secretion system component Hcp
MGARRRHAAEQEAAPRRAVVQRSEEPGNGVLELQRSAGNRAVAERIEVARDKDKGGDGDPHARKDRTLTLKGLSGPMTILSYTLGGGSKGPTGGSGGSNDREGGQAEIREITLTAKFDALGQEVYRANVSGKSLGDGDLETGYMTLHLTDVYVSQVQLSGSDKDQTISFTLNVGSVEFKEPSMGDNDKPGGTPENVTWDVPSPSGA